MSQRFFLFINSQSDSCKFCLRSIQNLNIPVTVNLIRIDTKAWIKRATSSEDFRIKDVPTLVIKTNQTRFVIVGRENIIQFFATQFPPSKKKVNFVDQDVEEPEPETEPEEEQEEEEPKSVPLDVDEEDEPPKPPPKGKKKGGKTKEEATKDIKFDAVELEKQRAMMMKKMEDKRRNSYGRGRGSKK
jgi:hypothetical protein